MYSQNYNTFAGDMLPPNKWTDEDIAWVQALLSQMTRAEQVFFHEYLYGASYPAYSSATTYAAGDKVIYNRGVYESNAGSNLNNPVSDAAYWSKTQDDSVGVYERIRYDSTRLKLEYALNKRYAGTFRQPPAQSDIFITKNATTVKSFNAGNTEAASAVGYNISTGFAGNTTTAPANTGFTVNISSLLLPVGGVLEVTTFIRSIVKAHATFDINVI